MLDTSRAKEEFGFAAKDEEEDKMRIPEFKTEEEEAQFWETHSLTDYLDELEEVELEWAAEEDACPKCGSKSPTQ